VLAACFDIGYILSDISDDERTASTVQRGTSQEYRRFLPPVDEQELFHRRTRIVYAYSGCLVWYA